MSFVAMHGFESTGFDLSDSEAKPQDLVDRHRLHEFDVIGFSVYNESFATTISMARRIKELNPLAFVLCGGPQATATHHEILVRHTELDGVIRKEGERPMLALLESLESGTALSAVPSLTFRQGDAVVVNCELPAADDLDSLPFPDAEFVAEGPCDTLAYYDQQRRENVPALTICSSRSCPYNCSFCGVLTIGRKYRSRSASNVVAEVDHFRKKTGIEYRHIYFSDANFFVQPKRALGIVKALHTYDARMTFSFGTRVNQLLKADIVVEQMMSYGLKFIEVGVESASPSVLQRLAKGVTPEVNEAAVRMLRRLGVEIALDFIMLDPSTTMDDIALNLDFLKGNGFSDYYPLEYLYTSLGLYEGTPIRDFYEERLGCKFTFGELPDVDGLFELEETRSFWRITQEFRRKYQDVIDTVLAELEFLMLDRAVQETLVSRSEASIDMLRLIQLDSVGLRHAGIRFFEEVLTHVRAGLEPTCSPVLEKLEFGWPAVHLQVLIERCEEHRRYLMHLVESRDAVAVTS
jgi:radical SAM superfamily enzyme YgiQ (UPF0313 family)